jgi:hypothetical protein
LLIFSIPGGLFFWLNWIGTQQYATGKQFISKGFTYAYHSTSATYPD